MAVSCGFRCVFDPTSNNYLKISDLFSSVTLKVQLTHYRIKANIVLVTTATIFHKETLLLPAVHSKHDTNLKVMPNDEIATLFVYKLIVSSPLFKCETLFHFYP